MRRDLSACSIYTVKSAMHTAVIMLGEYRLFCTYLGIVLNQHDRTHLRTCAVVCIRDAFGFKKMSAAASSRRGGGTNNKQQTAPPAPAPAPAGHTGPGSASLYARIVGLTAIFSSERARLVHPWPLSELPLGHTASSSIININSCRTFPAVLCFLLFFLHFQFFQLVLKRESLISLLFFVALSGFSASNKKAPTQFFSGIYS